MTYERNSYIKVIDPAVVNAIRMPEGASRVTIRTIEGTAVGNVLTNVNLKHELATKQTEKGAITKVTQSAAGILTTRKKLAGKFAVASNRLQFVPTVQIDVPLGIPAHVVCSAVSGKNLRYVEKITTVTTVTTYDLGYTSQADVAAIDGELSVLGTYGASNNTIGSEFLVAGAGSSKTLTGNLPYDIVAKNFIKKGSLVVQIARTKDAGFAGDVSRNSAPIILPVTEVTSTEAKRSITVEDVDGVLRAGAIHADLYAQNGFAGTLQEQLAYGTDSFGMKTIVINKASVVGTKAEVIVDVDQEIDNFGN